MAHGDGTGPLGGGRMTGRAAGYCAGFSVPGYANRGFGAGMGHGGMYGRGRGMWSGRGLAWRHGVAPFPVAMPPLQPTRDQELDGLRDQAKYLQSALEAINSRIETLKTENEQ